MICMFGCDRTSDLLLRFEIGGKAAMYPTCLPHFEVALSRYVDDLRRLVDRVDVPGVVVGDVIDVVEVVDGARRSAGTIGLPNPD